jgi:hypothetical protein
MVSVYQASRWLAVLAVLGVGIPRAHAGIVFSTFTSPNFVNAGSNSPIGFAFAGNKFVGSYYFTNGSGTTGLYSTDLTGGNIQPFGTSVFIPTGVPEEHFVASSLGLGGFPSRDIYVAAVGAIYHLTNSGASGGLFVSGLNGDVRAIAFDPYGSFGFKMLVSTTSGTIYTVDSAGVAKVLANVGEDAEGMDFAPPGGPWGSLTGDVFVASEGSGTVRAIDPSGNITPVASVASAEQLSFVPVNLGKSGSPLEGMYSADYPVDVIKADASQFNGLQGDLIVTGETTHAVTDLHPTGGAVVSTPEGFFPNQPEDGIFVTAAILHPIPEPASLLLLGIGAGGLLAFRRWSGRQVSVSAC